MKPNQKNKLTFVTFNFHRKYLLSFLSRFLTFLSNSYPLCYTSALIFVSLSLLSFRNQKYPHLSFFSLRSRIFNIVSHRTSCHSLISMYLNLCTSLLFFLFHSCFPCLYLSNLPYSLLYLFGFSHIYIFLFIWLDSNSSFPKANICSSISPAHQHTLSSFAVYSMFSKTYNLGLAVNNLGWN